MFQIPSDKWTIVPRGKRIDIKNERNIIFKSYSNEQLILTMD